MKISSKTYYGLKALANLAQAKNPKSAREIAREESIPQEYLEKIFQVLRKSDLVLSHRGVSGGYELSHPPQKITLADILAELEGPFFDLACMGSGCSQEKHCQTKDVWHQINKTLDEKFSQTTLADIIRHS